MFYTGRHLPQGPSLVNLLLRCLNDGLPACLACLPACAGELFSDDDFYLLSSGLMVLETTNHIYVGDVYKPMQPHCVLSWQRIRLANWMAATGEEWVDVFGRFNSGTYNNQVGGWVVRSVHSEISRFQTSGIY
jgi:hypothetical protein